MWSPRNPLSSPSSPAYSPLTTPVKQLKVPLHTELKHEQLPPPLFNVFPESYSYILQMFSDHDNSTPSNHAFSATVLVNVTSEIEGNKWIKDLEDHTATTYRVTRGNRVKGCRLIYKTDRHYQHKRKKATYKKTSATNHPLLRDKKTQCSSKLTLKLLNRSRPNVSYTHPCEVALIWDHNHSITSAHVLIFRPISQETKDQFYKYFEQGHSPSSAIHHHSLNLAIEYQGKDQDYEIAHADRSINPLPKDVYYLYKKWRVEKHGEENGEGMFSQLEKLVSDYNMENEQEGGRAFIQRYKHKHVETTSKGTDFSTDQPLVLAICTPLMARAHQVVRQAGELVYCDATSSLDRYNCPTFIMSTCTSTGGIPLGVVITSGESEAVITEAITFLKTTLPPNAFYSRGAKGPECALQMTVMLKEQHYIRSTWPHTTLLLCIFHYL